MRAQRAQRALDAASTSVILASRRDPAGAERAWTRVVMRRSIVLASDLTARSDRAMERAIATAEQWNAKLFVVHALEHHVRSSSSGPSWQRPSDSRSLAYERLCSDVGARANNVEVEIIVDRSNAASLVLDVAANVGAELVVAGVSRDEPFGWTRVGSTVEALARRSPTPVLVVKRLVRGAYHRIVVASDLSKASRTALVTALGFYPDARVTLFHAFQLPYASYLSAEVLRDIGRECADDEVREHLRRASIDARRLDVRCEHGQPNHLVADLTRAMRMDAVVVGRSRGRVAAFFLGSVSSSILVSAPTDVMVVPAPFASAGDAPVYASATA